MNIIKFSKHKLRKWSVSVRWRDRFCQICKTKKKLEAHHIFDKSNHPEKAYDLDNGITLCKRCHRAFHVSYKGGYGITCTLKDWKKFKALLEWAKKL